MHFTPECVPTAIGSFPHPDAASACDLILRTIPEIPVWPQLPNADFREKMDIQYSEGLPCTMLDEEKQRLHFDTGGNASAYLEGFYQRIVAEDYDSFMISPGYSRGIYKMEDSLSKMDSSLIKYFKNQVTGPVTFGLSIGDENKRSIYYNEMFRDVVLQAISMKARWLLRKFKRFGFHQICFVDEPIFSAFGSSTYVSVHRSDVVSCLKQVISSIQDEGALAGCHCCGNTEWTILMDAGVDIISFDSYQYGQTIGYYADKLRTFLDRGGVLAWGLVPTSERIHQETAESLVRKLDDLVKGLANKGIDKNLIWERCLLTPSCGTGSLSVESSAEILNQLSQASRLLRH